MFLGYDLPLATICSQVLEEKTRKPVSSAAEKQEQSALRETERTKGPLSESSIGRVFMLIAVKKSSWWGTASRLPKGSVGG
jgi:hypothetical protein